MFLVGGSNQPDSFSAKLRWVGRVCSWHCSPFQVLFSVLNSPRNRRKSKEFATKEGPRLNSPGPLSCPYSPECVEEKFLEVELPLYGVLRRSALPWCSDVLCAIA